jgi:hypothetical protein
MMPAMLRVKSGGGVTAGHNANMIAFKRWRPTGPGALLWGTGEFLLSQRDRVVALAARHRIPAMYILRD